MRRDRTRRELSQLQQDAAAWLEVRRKSDSVEQFATQLRAVATLIGEVTGVLSDATAGLDAGLEAGEFAGRCSGIELRILWLRRLWQYYRERFDQRDDPRLAGLLAAADEVVWSAYRPVVVMARDLEVPMAGGASPLPFIDAQYSPAATPRSWTPPELKRDGGPLLGLIEQLPIPLIHVPASCLSAPWWLVFIGHEAGHHIQVDLGIASSFEDLLGEAVRAEASSNGLADPDALGEQWRQWAEEVFADACFVSMFGPAVAGRALAEFELAPDERMRAARPDYPPAVVRLELIRALGREMKLAPGEAPFSPQPGDELSAHFRLVPAAAKVCAGAVANGKPLPELTLGSAGHDSLAWPALPEPFDLTGPRRMAGAAMRRWAELADEGATGADFDQLAQKVVEAIRVPRLPGRRAAATLADASKTAQQLGTALLETSADRLRGQVIA